MQRLTISLQVAKPSEFLYMVIANLLTQFCCCFGEASYLKKNIPNKNLKVCESIPHVRGILNLKSVSLLKIVYLIL